MWCRSDLANWVVTGERNYGTVRAHELIVPTAISTNALVTPCAAGCGARARVWRTAESSFLGGARHEVHVRASSGFRIQPFDEASGRSHRPRFDFPRLAGMERGVEGQSRRRR